MRQASVPPAGPLILLEAALIPVALALAALLGVDALQGAVLDGRAAIDGVLHALPLTALLVATVDRHWAPLRNMHAALDKLTDMLRHASLPELALLALAAGVGEEMLFRGAIQQALTDRLGPWPAVVVAAALFGMVHWVTPLYALAAGVIGLYLGVLYAETGNLWVPVLVHFLYDLFALVYLLRTTAPSPGEAL